MTHRPDYFQALAQLASVLRSNLHADDVQNQFMQTVGQLFKVRDSTFMLLAGRPPDLHFVIVAGEAVATCRGMTVKINEGIGGCVVQEGRGIVITDVSDDPRCARPSHPITGFNAGSLLCAPLVARGTLRGVVELIRDTTAPPFTADDLQALQPFADLAAIALDSASPRAEVEGSGVYDACTGLLNSRFLQSRLTQELLRAQRYVHPLSLVFIDLDHFKSVNDHLGQARGNALLQQVGHVFPKALRASDRAIRYGGDEFVILLPETPKLGAIVVAQRLRDALRPHFQAADLQSLNVSVSMGIASYPEDGDNEQALLNAADRALYRAKSLGRNCLVDASNNR